MSVPILKQGSFLIATVQAAMTDTDAVRLQDDLMEQVGRSRAKGVIIDVTAMDVMDSFAARSLQTIAHMTNLRGADTVIVGIQAQVAFAMVQMGMTFDDVNTALDLEAGLAFLDQHQASKEARRGWDARADGLSRGSWPVRPGLESRRREGGRAAKEGPHGP